jgi:hypothetical protein
MGGGRMEEGRIFILYPCYPRSNYFRASDAGKGELIEDDAA